MSGQTPSPSAISAGWRLGLLLGAVHVVNHSLEVFANLPAPGPAIRWYKTGGAHTTRSSVI
jgi:hypothetical protein